MSYAAILKRQSPAKAPPGLDNPPQVQTKLVKVENAASGLPVSPAPSALPLPSTKLKDAASAAPFIPSAVRMPQIHVHGIQGQLYDLNGIYGDFNAFIAILARKAGDLALHGIPKIHNPYESVRICPASRNVYFIDAYYAHVIGQFTLV